jgi:hypothetical protein
MKIAQMLSGGDLRSNASCALVVPKIVDQKKFDKLIELLHHRDRLVVMRVADAIEKITKDKPFYLSKHKAGLIELLHTAEDKELKWHMAQLMPRLPLNPVEFSWIWDTLVSWAKDASNSRLVRVSATQSLYLMALQHKELLKKFLLLAKRLEKDNIPSVNARIRNIRKELKLA